MTFGQPLWFWGLGILPIFLLLFLLHEGRRKALLRKLVAARLEDRLAGTVSAWKRALKFSLTLLGLACVILSLTQPRFGFTWETSQRKGRDILIAIDVSKSMLANDVAPDRLSKAKFAAQDLIQQLGGDRVGLVAFAGTAFLQAPLTADFSAIMASLAEMDSEIIPQGGSNFAEAIRVSQEAFGKGESESRALIIFSDGEELDADGLKEAEKARETMKIFTVGVGTAEGSLIPRPGAGGGTEFVRDASGQYVKSRLDEGKLREIAKLAGGFYVHLQRGPADMKTIVADGLSKMNEQDIDAKLSRQPIERYQWPLGAGLLLLAGAMLVGERKRGMSVAKKLTKLAVAAAMLLAVPSLQARNNGLEAYEQQDYAAAQQRFTEQLKRQPESEALQFNLGSAAYKVRDYPLALEAFGKALRSPDPKLQALTQYNLGNTLFQLGDQVKEKDKKIATWTEALDHYDETLKIDPANADAQHNREVVAKMLEDLKKPQDQQNQQNSKDQKDQKKDQDRKDQQQSEQSKDGQGKEDQQKSEQEKKDQQAKGDPAKPEEKERSEKNASEKKDEEKSGQENDAKEQNASSDEKKGKEGGQKDKGEQGKDGKEGKESDKGDMAEPTPEESGPMKQGELKSNPVGGEDQQAAEKAEAQAAEEMAAAQEGKMTESQAKQLLESLRSEDERVRLLDPKARKNRGRVLRDW